MLAEGYLKSAEQSYTILKSYSLKLKIQVQSSKIKAKCGKMVPKSIRMVAKV